MFQIRFLFLIRLYNMFITCLFAVGFSYLLGCLPQDGKTQAKNAQGVPATGVPTTQQMQMPQIGDLLNQQAVSNIMFIFILGL